MLLFILFPNQIGLRNPKIVGKTTKTVTVLQAMAQLPVALVRFLVLHSTPFINMTYCRLEFICECSKLQKIRTFNGYIVIIVVMNFRKYFSAKIIPV